tara:strand:- start:314 stop:892 length:579 start_codon:yes stop_codon:yes gene_type:complete
MKKKHNFEIFITGKSIDLVIIDKKFLKKNSWHTWLNDQKLTKYTKQGYFPLTKKEHEKYVEENIFTKKRIQLGIIKKSNDILIGMISLYNINQFDQCAAVSALMNMSSKEIGSIEYFLEAQNLIIEHAFRKLNLRRIEAAANDSKLCHMNEKLFGFKCEGVLKEKDFINGIFTDRYILAILKKDWDRRKHKI